MKLWPFKKKQKKKYIGTVFGVLPIGMGSLEVHFNLYETDNGERSFTRFTGKENFTKRSGDYKASAKVDAWVHGGNLPKCKPILTENDFKEIGNVS